MPIIVSFSASRRRRGPARILLVRAAEQRQRRRTGGRQCRRRVGPAAAAVAVAAAAAPAVRKYYYHQLLLRARSHAHLDSAAAVQPFVPQSRVFRCCVRPRRSVHRAADSSARAYVFPYNYSPGISCADRDVGPPGVRVRCAIVRDFITAAAATLSLPINNN